jgi:hypothetical protein
MTPLAHRPVDPATAESTDILRHQDVLAGEGDKPGRR